MTFKQAFFRIYDRKVASGEITFNKTGIKKSEFTRLCVEDGYVFDKETIEMIGFTMFLTDEEKKLLQDALDSEARN